MDDTAVKIITQKLSENTDAKILIAYNSLDGILNILELLKKRIVDGVNNSNCGILCSERNNDKVKEYIEDADNVISEDANLQKRIVFMTCAYFAGIDIQDRCHLITITSICNHLLICPPKEWSKLREDAEMATYLKP